MNYTLDTNIITAFLKNDERIKTKLQQLIGDERTGDADILIAALALTRDLILVTDNIRHFQRIKNLIVENWLKP